MGEGASPAAGELRTHYYKVNSERLSEAASREARSVAEYFGSRIEFSDEESFSYDPSTGILQIRGTEADIEIADQLVRGVNWVPPMVSLEVELYCMESDLGDSDIGGWIPERNMGEAQMALESANAVGRASRYTVLESGELEDFIQRNGILERERFQAVLRQTTVASMEYPINVTTPGKTRWKVARGSEKMRIVGDEIRSALSWSCAVGSDEPELRFNLSFSLERAASEGDSKSGVGENGLDFGKLIAFGSLEYGQSIVVAKENGEGRIMLLAITPDLAY